MKILKFGGTTVGSVQRMHDLVHLIDDDDAKIVVLSAMSGTTNALVEISNALYRKDHDQAGILIGELEEKYNYIVTDLYSTKSAIQNGLELINVHFDFLRSFTRDLFTVNEEKAILAQGELLSTALFQFLLEEKAIDSVLIPALNFMRLDENSEPDMAFISVNLQLILKEYPDNKLFITQGYISRNDFGEIDNLKRGGSDYTATIVGAAIDAEEIQIWTDIDGMHNNDPREVNNTFPIAQLSFDEAAELAYFGAKILHPTCILPAKNKNIPVKLLNTMQPEAAGTIISSGNQLEGFRAIAAKDGITAINIKSGRMLMAYGFLRAVFEVFERNKKPIDMITTSEVAVSVTIDNTENLDQIGEELSAFGNVKIDTNLSIVSVVGLFPVDKPGYAAAIFDALRDIPVRMISYGGSENNISVLVDTQHKRQTLIALNKGLFKI